MLPANPFTSRHKKLDATLAKGSPLVKAHPFREKLEQIAFRLSAQRAEAI